MEDNVGAKFYCLHALADGNQHHVLYINVFFTIIGSELSELIFKYLFT